MPLYEYRCRECGHEEEHMHSVQERDTEHRCPGCGAVLCKSIGNKGGFRLSKDGTCGWADEGYCSSVGDAANFKAGRKVYDKYKA